MRRKFAGRIRSGTLMGASVTQLHSPIAHLHALIIHLHAPITHLSRTHHTLVNIHVNILYYMYYFIALIWYKSLPQPIRNPYPWCASGYGFAGVGSPGKPQGYPWTVTALTFKYYLPPFTIRWWGRACWFKTAITKLVPRRWHLRQSRFGLENKKLE